MSVELIDTHCHLDADAFSQDRDGILERAAGAGVVRMLTIGIDAATSAAAVQLAEQHAAVSAVVGIQPNYVHEVKPDDWETVVAMLDHPSVVGIGETGLDRYWDYAPLDTQVEYFHRHIQLSKKSGLPFVVHCREAEADVLQVLREEAKSGALSGVMHSFCGDSDVAAECLSLGMHISFGGMVTFRRNDELRAVAATVPLDRLLIETDAPYLAPHPKRGKRNEPAWVCHTAECLAEVHDVSLEELARQTTTNANGLFGA